MLKAFRIGEAAGFVTQVTGWVGATPVTVAYSVAIGEWVLGSMLLGGFALRVVRPATILFLISMTGVLVFAAGVRGVDTCPCLGWAMPLAPALVKNAVLLVLLSPSALMASEVVPQRRYMS
ncbi:MAG: hypothetical protein KIS87_05825 [Phycisphaeraceae bacterium]|nr:hypothetical protein [Phycisphaeraceae bacterium]